MAVSIIIPAYNSEKYIAAAIQSVLTQTRDDWDLIIVNDGSTDQTGTIAETFAAKDNRIRVVHQANAGVSAARNRGFAESRADYKYCMFFDSDDVLEPNAIEILLHAIEHPGAVAAHGMVRYIDSEGKPTAINGRYTNPSRRHGVQGKRLKLWPLSAPTTFAVLAYGGGFFPPILVQRAKQVIVGDYDTNLKANEDWDMWLRLSLLGDIAFANQIVSSYRRHEGNISNDRQAILQGELYVRKKMYTSADLDEYHKKIILIGYRYEMLKKAYQRFIYTTRNIRRWKWIKALTQFREAIRHIMLSINGDL